MAEAKVDLSIPTVDSAQQEVFRDLYNIYKKYFEENKIPYKPSDIYSIIRLNLNPPVQEPLGSLLYRIYDYKPGFGSVFMQTTKDMLYGAERALNILFHPGKFDEIIEETRLRALDRLQRDVNYQAYLAWVADEPTAENFYKFDVFFGRMLPEVLPSLTLIAGSMIALQPVGAGVAGIISRAAATLGTATKIARAINFLARAARPALRYAVAALPMTVMEAGSVQEQVLHEYLSKKGSSIYDKDLSQKLTAADYESLRKAMNISALMYAPISAAIEMLQVATLLKPLGMEAIHRAIAKNALTKGAVRAALSRLTFGGIITAFEEGLEEGLQQIWQNVSTQLTVKGYNDVREFLSKTFNADVLESFLSGLPLGILGLPFAVTGAYRVSPKRVANDLTGYWEKLNRVADMTEEKKKQVFREYAKLRREKTKEYAYHTLGLYEQPEKQGETDEVFQRYWNKVLGRLPENLRNILTEAEEAPQGKTEKIYTETKIGEGPQVRITSKGLNIGLEETVSDKEHESNKAILTDAGANIKKLTEEYIAELEETPEGRTYIKIASQVANFLHNKRKLSKDVAVTNAINFVKGLRGEATSLGAIKPALVQIKNISPNLAKVVARSVLGNEQFKKYSNDEVFIKAVARSVSMLPDNVAVRINPEYVQEYLAKIDKQKKPFSPDKVVDRVPQEKKTSFLYASYLHSYAQKKGTGRHNKVLNESELYEKVLGFSPTKQAATQKATKEEQESEKGIADRIVNAQREKEGSSEKKTPPEEKKVSPEEAETPFDALFAYAEESVEVSESGEVPEDVISETEKLVKQEMPEEALGAKKGKPISSEQLGKFLGKKETEERTEKPRKTLENLYKDISSTITKIDENLNLLTAVAEKPEEIHRIRDNLESLKSEIAKVSKSPQKESFLKRKESEFKKVAKDIAHIDNLIKKYGALGGLFRIGRRYIKAGKYTLPLIEDAPDVYKRIVSKLRRDYPQIEARIVEKIDTGSIEDKRTLGIAIGKVVEWVEKGAPLDVPPHEYAHVVINSMRDHPVVKKAIKAFNGEENLVKYMGEYYAKRALPQSIKAKLKYWLRRIWLAVKEVFGKLTPLEVGEVLAERFYSGRLQLSVEDLDSLLRRFSTTELTDAEEEGYIDEVTEYFDVGTQSLSKHFGVPVPSDFMELVTYSALMADDIVSFRARIQYELESRFSRGEISKKTYEVITSRLYDPIFTALFLYNNKGNVAISVHSKYYRDNTFIPDGIAKNGMLIIDNKILRIRRLDYAVKHDAIKTFILEKDTAGRETYYILKGRERSRIPTISTTTALEKVLKALNVKEIMDIRFMRLSTSYMTTANNTRPDEQRYPRHYFSKKALDTATADAIGIGYVPFAARGDSGKVYFIRLPESIHKSIINEIKSKEWLWKHYKLGKDEDGNPELRFTPKGTDVDGIAAKIARYINNHKYVKEYREQVLDMILPGWRELGSTGKLFKRIGLIFTPTFINPAYIQHINEKKGGSFRTLFLDPEKTLVHNPTISKEPQGWVDDGASFISEEMLNDAKEAWGLHHSVGAIKTMWYYTNLRDSGIAIKHSEQLPLPGTKFIDKDTGEVIAEVVREDGKIKIKGKDGFDIDMITSFNEVKVSAGEFKAEHGKIVNIPAIARQLITLDVHPPKRYVPQSTQFWSRITDRKALDILNKVAVENVRKTYKEIARMLGDPNRLKDFMRKFFGNLGDEVINQTVEYIRNNIGRHPFVGNLMDIIMIKTIRGLNRGYKTGDMPVISPDMYGATKEGECLLGSATNTFREILKGFKADNPEEKPTLSNINKWLKKKPFYITGVRLPVMHPKGMLLLRVKEVLPKAYGNTIVLNHTDVDRHFIGDYDIDHLFIHPADEETKKALKAISKAVEEGRERIVFPDVEKVFSEAIVEEKKGDNPNSSNYDLNYYISAMGKANAFRGVAIRMLGSYYFAKSVGLSSKLTIKDGKNIFSVTIKPKERFGNVHKDFLGLSPRDFYTVLAQTTVDDWKYMLLARWDINPMRLPNMLFEVDTNSISGVDESNNQIEMTPAKRRWIASRAERHGIPALYRYVKAVFDARNMSVFGQRSTIDSLLVASWLVDELSTKVSDLVFGNLGEDIKMRIVAENRNHPLLTIGSAFYRFYEALTEHSNIYKEIMVTPEQPVYSIWGVRYKEPPAFNQHVSIGSIRSDAIISIQRESTKILDKLINGAKLTEKGVETLRNILRSIGIPEEEIDTADKVKEKISLVYNVKGKLDRNIRRAIEERYVKDFVDTYMKYLKETGQWRITNITYDWSTRYREFINKALTLTDRMRMEIPEDKLESAMVCFNHQVIAGINALTQSEVDKETKKTVRRPLIEFAGVGKTSPAYNARYITDHLPPAEIMHVKRVVEAIHGTDKQLSYMELYFATFNYIYSSMIDLEALESKVDELSDLIKQEMENRGC